MKKISSYWNSVSARATDFKVGDWVMRYDSVFPGMVVGVHPGINLVDVDYPLGWEREEPEELILLTLFSAMPPSPSGTGSKSAKKLRKKRSNKFRRFVYTMNNYSGMNYMAAPANYKNSSNVNDEYAALFRSAKVAGLSREQRVLSLVQDYDY